MELYRGDAETLQEMDICKDVAETLHQHYPGHLWAVSVQNGAVVVKNLKISHTHGMIIHLKNYFADPSNKLVIRLGGELLERAHIKRGRDDGENAYILEGAAAKYQPTNGIIR